MARRKDSSCDAIFKRNMITCIAGILICMVSLCATSFAWFTEDVNSSSNVIKTASYDVNITVQEEGGAGVEYTVDGYNLSADANAYMLTGGKVYTVTIEAMGNAERGFCKLIVNGTKTLYTECIPTRSGNGITFELGFAADTLVQFVSSWGEPSQEVTIRDGGSYVEAVEETTTSGDTEIVSEPSSETEGESTEEKSAENTEA